MASMSATAAIGLALAAAFSTLGCQGGPSPPGTGEDVRQALTRELRKACMDASGGTRMDAVELYGGRLSHRCTEWAYREARKRTR